MGQRAQALWWGRRAPLVVSGGVRGAKKSASQLRVGDILTRDGQLARVIKFVWAHGKSRAQGHVSIDTLELSTRKRSSARMKTDETVEYVELTGKTVQVLYIDGATVHLMDEATHETAEVPLELFGDAEKWIRPEMEVTLRMHGDEPATVTVPIKQSYTVVEARDAVFKFDGSAPMRPVTLDCGVDVMAPAHVKTGDKIVVNIEEGTYHGKA
ncbi:hypothetical protein FOA52_012457 [Chlamydomonas sp. UWO 241]|nr:hypothetical protein FOA52_012457 [Chlamydomonas sp. UWO 241]